ncbi:hypothetical protein ACFPRL_10690 [Pseudoclavibacter helvolus]
MRSSRASLPRASKGKGGEGHLNAQCSPVGILDVHALLLDDGRRGRSHQCIPARPAWLRSTRPRSTVAGDLPQPAERLPPPPVLGERPGGRARSRPG